MTRNVDTIHPTISITSERTYVIENETLHKLGATTGWTYGAVEDRCGDAYTSGWLKLCSDRLDVGVQGGDSGGPVFAMKYDGTAELVGIVFAQAGWPFNDTYLSNLHRIYMDLGGLVVAQFSAKIDGPTLVPPNGTCSWYAWVQGGRGPATYQWQKEWPTVGDDAMLFLNTGDTSFNLTLTVSDADDNIVHDTKYIEVDPFAPLPPQCY